MPGDIPGSEVSDPVDWYDDHADEVIGRYESPDPEKVNDWLRGFLPDRSAFILDVGAGSAGTQRGWLRSVMK